MYQLIWPRIHGEVFDICEVFVVIDAATLEVAHDVIPGEGHGVLVVADSVVVFQGVRQEFLGMQVNVAFLVYNSQDNNCNLKRKMENGIEKLLVPTHDYTSKQKMMTMKIPYAVSRTLDSLMEPQ